MPSVTRGMSQRSHPRRPHLESTVTLAHGSGGRAMHDLIDSIFVAHFQSDPAPLDDQARIDLVALTRLGDRLAFTTDSYVVDPLFFPGSNIGELAVNGTVNDLCVSGAIPLYLTCSVILEEGLSTDLLAQIVDHMAIAAARARVQIVTGDTKVVPRGSVDKIFINTAGIGVMRAGVNPCATALQPGDRILINGAIGNHGAAILVARGELALDTDIQSDCRPLNSLVDAIVAVCPDVRAMRDATRGGVATVLNEFATASQVSIQLQEEDIPIDEPVAGLCELLGLDPLYLANEGKLVVVVPAHRVDETLAAMRSHPAGQGSCCIGQVGDRSPGLVSLQTAFGTERVVDVLVGDQLPRIC
ncbi:MAG TPA: hydrogenase expression/formation protein HypE [Candidatus Obscuribacterales bacterium]